jgi:hypothetical protein
MVVAPVVLIIPVPVLCRTKKDFEYVGIMARYGEPSCLYGGLVFYTTIVQIVCYEKDMDGYSSRNADTYSSTSTGGL